MFFNRSNRYSDICFRPPRMLLGLWLGTIIFLMLFSHQQAILADDDNRIVLEIPVYGQTFSTGSVLSEAESLAGDTISRQFSQDDTLTTVQVLVMASRNGEILPILETIVSRDQWQERADVRSWSSYFQASYALLSRNDDQQATGIVSTGLNQSMASQSNRTLWTAQIDAAIDSGRLSGAQIQGVLDEVD